MKLKANEANAQNCIQGLPSRKIIPKATLNSSPATEDKPKMRPKATLNSGPAIEEH